MKILLTALLMVLLSGPALAAGRCYTAEETRAENVLRLHSELMVITVTCKQSSSGRDLVRAYTGFTRRNIEQIKKAEKTMSRHYAARHGGDGISQLDTLRTKLANEFGQQSADASAPRFCAQRRDRVIALYDSPPASLEAESIKAYATSWSYEPPCDKSLKTAAAKPESNKANNPEDVVKSTEAKTKKAKKDNKG